jgi:CspA family cold shock protein
MPLQDRAVKSQSSPPQTAFQAAPEVAANSLPDPFRLRPGFVRTIDRGSNMATGIVRFFNNVKGFGLITPDLGGPAIFALSSEIQSAGKKLMPRQRVEFELREAPTGGTATRIRILPQ